MVVEAVGGAGLFVLGHPGFQRGHLPGAARGHIEHALFAERLGFLRQVAPG